MELVLSDDDARTLRDLLRDHVRELQLEVARTEARDFRHILVLRRDLIERLLARLDRELPDESRTGGPPVSMT